MGTRVLVTGGTSGVGRELVSQLVDRGCRVVTCGRDPHRCASLRSQLPDVLVVEADLAGPGVGSDLVGQAAQHLGGLDVVINNAGIQLIDDFVSGERSELMDGARAQIAVNLQAPVDITAAAIPVLRESSAARIVFVTSGLAVFPKKSAPVYCATKSALRTFAASLRYQLEDGVTNIAVIDAVLPLVDTPMTAGRGKDSEKIGVADVARRIIETLESPRPVLSIGKARLLPWLVRLAPSVGRRALRNG